MIKTILIINNFGKPRLTKFYEDLVCYLLVISVSILVIFISVFVVYIS